MHNVIMYAMYIEHVHNCTCMHVYSYECGCMYVCMYM